MNTQTNRVIATVKDDKVEIREPMLKRLMANQGVKIPSFAQGSFGNRKFVKLDDDGFARAFKDIYCKMNMKSGTHKWTRITE